MPGAAAESILIERIPGKSTVGIEVPNQHRQTITLREVIESPEFVNSTSKLTLALGKDLIGRMRVSDLAQMPHLLIAGSTGTGKSVFLNSLIVSMLYKATPDELKLVMVDPKRLELGLYEDIPHLLAPVVTDPKVASNVLRNATREMERRLKLLAQRGVRNIDQYNRTFTKGQSLSLFENVEEEEHKPLPLIVIVIDELADLMMVDTNNVEESITRLAQMARAVGIHLILATQRPSVDVITGLIKANFPARISFRVASKVDSRTILDANGAESLLGTRRHAVPARRDLRGCTAFTGRWSARRRSRRCAISGARRPRPSTTSSCSKPPKEEHVERREPARAARSEVDDDLYQEAVRVVCEMGRASTSTLQRRLRIGYGRAARLIDIMEKDGIVGPAGRHQTARSAEEERLDARVRRVGEVSSPRLPAMLREQSGSAASTSQRFPATIFGLHRCRGSSPVERGPEKAGVGSSTLPPGTIFRIPEECEMAKGEKDGASGARDKLIQGLNEDLAREYQAIIAYVAYSQVLNGAEYMNIARELETHAAQELQHALIIAKQVDYLGGTVCVNPSPSKQRKTTKKCCRPI